MTKRKSKALIVLGIILTITILISGFFVYTKDIRYRLADARMCKKGIFHYQTKKLEDGCYNAKSYGGYNVIWVSEAINIDKTKNDIKEFFLHNINSQNHINNISYELQGATSSVNSNMERFTYDLDDEYRAIWCLDRKKCVGILCREVGDIAHVMIFKKDTSDLHSGYEIIIAKSNPANYGKGDFQDGRPYKRVSQKDIQNIIKLVFENDKLK